MKQIEHVDEIIRDSFGLWISGLFSAIGSWNPMLSFEEREEAFFWLIEQLLLTGRIRFIAPGADCYTSPENPHPKFTIYDDEVWWKEAPETIVAQLRTQWPQCAHDESEMDMVTYFYSIPGVIWVGEDGALVAS